MREQIEARLRALTGEYKAGQAMLTELEAKESNVRFTLARISGAIQVLEELLCQTAPASQPPVPNVSAEAASTAAA